MEFLFMKTHTWKMEKYLNVICYKGNNKQMTYLIANPKTTSVLLHFI